MVSWKGRIIGAIIAGLFFGPVGAVVGFILGYFFVDKPKMASMQSDEQARNTLFTADSNYNRELIKNTFVMMGYVARGAGRINEDHITKTTQMMDVMHLDEQSRQIAKDAFNLGKSPDYRIDDAIAAIKSTCRRNTNIISYLLEIQVQIALADGILENLEHQRLLEISNKLGVSSEAMERLIRLRLFEMMINRQNGNFGGGFESSGNQGYQERQQNQQSGYQYNYGYGDNGSSQSGSNETQKLYEAYEILGVNKDASWDDIRRAHKKLMLKYHPDKLASQGLPPEMINLYTEKAKDIQAAFDLIKKAKGM